MSASRSRATTLSRYLKPLFEAAVRTRGDDYVARRRVIIYAWTNTSILAVARGTADYQVRLTRDAPNLDGMHMSCTCPYYRDSGSCKHMWAFARTVEADARWDASWNRPNPDIDLDSAALEMLDGHDEDGDEGFDFDFDSDTGDLGTVAADADEDDGDTDFRPVVAPPAAGLAKRSALAQSSRSQLTAAERRRVSERMKQYWALRRAAEGRPTAALGATFATKVPKPQKPKPDADATAAKAARQRLERLKQPLHIEALARRQHGPLAHEDDAQTERIFIIDATAARQYRQLCVHVATRTRIGQDGWSAPVPCRLSADSLATVSDADERDTLALLIGVSAGAASYSYYGPPATSIPFGVASTPHIVPEQWHTILLPRLFATRRCFLFDVAHSDRYQQLQWDERPWAISLELALDKPGDSQKYALTGRLSRQFDAAAGPMPPAAIAPVALAPAEMAPSSETAETLSGVAPMTTALQVHQPVESSIPATAPSLVLGSGLIFHEDTVSPVTGAGLAWLTDLRTNGRLRFPAGHVDQLLGTLLELPSAPPVSVPSELHFDTVRAQPTPVLTLRPSRYADGRFHATLAFDYDGVRVARADERSAMYQPSPRRLIVRNEEAEQRAERALEEHRLKLQRVGGPPGSVRIDVPRKRVPSLVRDLAPFGWRIEVEGKAYRVAHETTVDVQSGIDWFEIGGMVNFDGVSMALPELLAAVTRGENAVVLSDGSIGIVPDAWKAQYGALATFTHAEHGGRLRVKMSQLSLVDALLTTKPAVSWDTKSQHLRERLRGFHGIVPADASATFIGVLRDYQRQGLAWLRFLAELGLGGCLADDMGLGKTVMVLALLDAQRGSGPSLVVVPRSVLFNWRSEAARFTPQLRVLDYSGTDRNALDEAHLKQADLVLTTYGTLRRDVTRLADLALNYVILDEAQAIKNAATVSAKAVRLLNARHRLALSGTPIENHVGELWSLFEFLNPGLLGSAHRGLVSRARAGDRSALETLRQGLRPYILRRTKSQVAAELPSRSEDTIVCELDAFDRLRYDELRDHYRAAILGLVDRQGVTRSRFQVLEALLRLRQASCHPGLIDTKRQNDSSAKVEALVERLDEVVAEGHKALVFSQFTGLLALVKPVLQERGIVFEYLDGKTKDRDARVHRFQTDPSCAAFLISLKAGGLGLNLTAAEYVFLLDPWWNPAVEAQAIDRAHRIGQEKPVFAYRLIAKDTVEERILELQARKRAVADAIITADNSALGDLTRQDLELLLS